MGKYKVTRNCNICELVRKMSDDHVPPKSCNNKGRIEYHEIFKYTDNNKPSIFQNGVYYQSICESCNNDLGKKYDSELSVMVQRVMSKMPKGRNESINVKCKVNRVTRAIAGHLLTAFGEYNPSGQIEKQLRDYFIDESKNNINDLYLYCGVYEYDEIVIARNFGIWGHSPFHDSVISVLKFYPLMFILSTKKVNENLIDLFDYTSSDLDDVINLEIHMESSFYLDGNRKQVEWPLHVTNDFIFVGSKNAMSNTVRSKKKSKIFT